MKRLETFLLWVLAGIWAWSFYVLIEATLDAVAR